MIALLSAGVKLLISRTVSGGIFTSPNLSFNSPCFRTKVVPSDRRFEKSSAVIERVILFLESYLKPASIVPVTVVVAGCLSVAVVLVDTLLITVVPHVSLWKRLLISGVPGPPLRTSVFLTTPLLSLNLAVNANESPE